MCSQLIEASELSNIQSARTNKLKEVYHTFILKEFHWMMAFTQSHFFCEWNDSIVIKPIFDFPKKDFYSTFLHSTYWVIVMILHGRIFLEIFRSLDPSWNNRQKFFLSKTSLQNTFKTRLVTNRNNFEHFGILNFFYWIFSKSLPHNLSLEIWTHIFESGKQNSCS